MKAAKPAKAYEAREIWPTNPVSTTMDNANRAKIDDVITAARQSEPAPSMMAAASAVSTSVTGTTRRGSGAAG